MSRASSGGPPPRSLSVSTTGAVAGTSVTTPVGTTPSVTVGGPPVQLPPQLRDGFDAKVGGQVTVQRPVVDGVVPRRRLPPLREALVDPAVPATLPGAIPVPSAIVDALRDAKKVLVIGHARPADGDCVGSALGLTRGLMALGKEAVAVVDQDLPASLRSLDPDQQLRRARDVDASAFDLVVLVDVAQADRTGDMAEVIKAAKNVMVIDHHDEPDARAALGVSADARLTTWIDVDFDAAAAQVGAAVHAVARATGGDVEAAVGAAAPSVAAGLYTDTLGFTAPGADLATLSLFKGLAVDVLGGGATAGALGALDRLEQGLAAKLPDDVEATLRAGLVMKEARGPLGVEPVLGVHGTALAAALTAMQQHDARAVEGDLTGLFFNALDAAGDKAGGGHACLVMPAKDGWRVSVRGERALLLGRRISTDGGGKPGAAVAMLSSSMAPTLAAAMGLVQKALREQALADAALMRVGR